MKTKSVLDIAQAIHEKLMQVSSIVNDFEQRAYFATGNWINWLKESEELLIKFQYGESAQLAGLRATILGESFPILPTRNRRRQVFSRAIQTINPAQDILFGLYKILTEKIEVVRVLIRQILIPAKEAGFIEYDSSIDFTRYIESLLQQLKSHEQLKPSINSAIASIGKIDVMRLLAEEIEFG
ncbi:MAG: hypothetical protein LBI45_07470 [Bacteroidales bacterium]|jgi:hypothetical protein|nr:hypothetical protein [Bacteroidales bacterium]